MFNAPMKNAGLLISCLGIILLVFQGRWQDEKELKELISYVFVGGCTTMVNFVIYWSVIKIIDQNWLIANVISWIGAVIFAFWANKRFVFKSVNEAEGSLSFFCDAFRNINC